MAIPKNPVTAIVEADLQALVAEGVREDRTTEFKRDTYREGKDDKAEYLKDVSALANTLGGDLVLGVDETQGAASAIPGLRSEIDVDQEIRRLTQIAQTGLQPRLAALNMHAVELATGAHALVIRVGRSYNGPHRIVQDGSRRNQFWIRTDGGCNEPDVDQLRELFSAAPQLDTRLRELKGERIAQVRSGETPVPVQSDPGTSIMHLIPLAATGLTPRPVDLGRLFSCQEAWSPWGATGYNHHRNFDGFVTFSGAEGQESRAYCQVFRSGMVEVMATGTVSMLGSDRFVWVDQFAKQLLKQAWQILLAFRHADVDPPYSLHLAISGVKGARFMMSNFQSTLSALRPPPPVTRDVLTFVTTLVSEEHVSQAQVAAAIRPVLDQLFQTASYEVCPWFDAQGKFTLPS